MLDTWTALYSNHALLRTGVGFLHILGLVAGGGCAITADLATITRARDRTAERSTQLHLLKRTHTIVVTGLAALVVSGLLLFAADVETYLTSRVFWFKMGLLALLVINGVAMLGGERRVARGEPEAWTRLHYLAISSLVLWGLVTLAGTALPNL